MRRFMVFERKMIVLEDDGTWEYASPSGSTLEKWQPFGQSPPAVELFLGLFDKLGVRVIDTGEELTCVHRGDRIEIVAGLDDDVVDLKVEIYAFQAERLAEQLAKGGIDELERFRIARELFVRSSGRRNILRNPLMSSVIWRHLIRGKALIHLYLVSPDPEQEEDASCTLLFINGRWLLVPGVHGEAQRVFRTSVSDLVEAQRHLFAGMKAARWSEWFKIAKWYVEWRRRVEVPRSA